MPPTKWDDTLSSRLVPAARSVIASFFCGGPLYRLAEAGVEMGGQANLAHPRQVASIHRSYVETESRGLDI